MGSQGPAAQAAQGAPQPRAQRGERASGSHSPQPGPDGTQPSALSDLTRKIAEIQERVNSMSDAELLDPNIHRHLQGQHSAAGRKSVKRVTSSGLSNSGLITSHPHLDSFDLMRSSGHSNYTQTLAARLGPASARASGFLDALQQGLLDIESPSRTSHSALLNSMQTTLTQPILNSQGHIKYYPSISNDCISPGGLLLPAVEQQVYATNLLYASTGALDSTQIDITATQPALGAYGARRPANPRSANEPSSQHAGRGGPRLKHAGSSGLVSMYTAQGAIQSQLLVTQSGEPLMPLVSFKGQESVSSAGGAICVSVSETRMSEQQGSDSAPLPKQPLSRGVSVKERRFSVHAALERIRSESQAGVAPSPAHHSHATPTNPPPPRPSGSPRESTSGSTRSLGHSQSMHDMRASLHAAHAKVSSAPASEAGTGMDGPPSGAGSPLGAGRGRVHRAVSSLASVVYGDAQFMLPRPVSAPRLSELVDVERDTRQSARERPARRKSTLSNAWPDPSQRAQQPSLSGSPSEHPPVRMPSNLAVHFTEPVASSHPPGNSTEPLRPSLPGTQGLVSQGLVESLNKALPLLSRRASSPRSSETLAAPAAGAQPKLASRLSSGTVLVEARVASTDSVRSQPLNASVMAAAGIRASDAAAAVAQPPPSDALLAALAAAVSSNSGPVPLLVPDESGMLVPVPEAQRAALVQETRQQLQSLLHGTLSGGGSRSGAPTVAYGSPPLGALSGYNPSALLATRSGSMLSDTGAGSKARGSGGILTSGSGARPTPTNYPPTTSPAKLSTTATAAKPPNTTRAVATQGSRVVQVQYGFLERMLVCGMVFVLAVNVYVLWQLISVLPGLAGK